MIMSVHIDMCYVQPFPNQGLPFILTESSFYLLKEVDNIKTNAYFSCGFL